MKSNLIGCAAAVYTLAVGSLYLATPAEATTADEPCPVAVAEAVQAEANGHCVANGYTRAVVTFLNCTPDPLGGGQVDLQYACV